MAVVEQKRAQRNKRRTRIRKKVLGTAERPRLSVYRSNSYTYAQLIDDDAGRTMAAIDTREVASAENRVEAAHEAGRLLAQRALEAGIEAVVFDRGGNLFHGRVKALAEGARAGGLKF